MYLPTLLVRICWWWFLPRHGSCHVTDPAIFSSDFIWGLFVTAGASWYAMAYLDRDQQAYYIVLEIMYSTSENASNKIWFFF